MSGIKFGKTEKYVEPGIQSGLGETLPLIPALSLISRGTGCSGVSDVIAYLQTKRNLLRDFSVSRTTARKMDKGDAHRKRK